MEDVWVFGYGSLIWRVDFPYVEREPAFINDWSRRFWQGSTDHRGVPGAPGRVVTLIETPGEQCHGMAYRLDTDRLEETLDHLDYREKGGYERLQLAIHLRSGTTVSGITYHATIDNPNFLGATDPLEIAHQVVNSTGPSGANSEYVLMLDHALRELEAPDLHVSEIARSVRNLQ